MESFLQECQSERTLNEDIDTEGRVAMSHTRGVDSLPSLGKCFQCCSTPTIVPNGGQMVAGYLTSVHFPNVTCLCLLMTELRGGEKTEDRILTLCTFHMPHLLPEKGHRNDEFVTPCFLLRGSSEKILRGSLIFPTHSNGLDHKQKFVEIPGFS